MARVQILNYFGHYYYLQLYRVSRLSNKTTIFEDCPLGYAKRKRYQVDEPPPHTTTPQFKH